MTLTKCRKIFQTLLLLSIFFTLNSCDGSVLNAHGEIAKQEYSLIIIAFIMMLFVVLPVIFMTLYFSIKYRASNTNQKYRPNWSDSKKIEIVIWTVPVLIISFLAYLTWYYTHKLEPSKPLISQYRPIKVNVIALDWKWLFIYPQYHIATINKIVFPSNRPVTFHITSNSVMNSFFIPALGSQIYAMPGMITTLNLIAKDPGFYKGISSNYSGSGFSNMKFITKVVKNNKDFIYWINKVKKSSKVLKTIRDFKLIAVPNENDSIEYFSYVNLNLFDYVVKQFCMKNSFNHKIIK